MKPLEFVVVLLCVLLGLGRGADLAFATDAATGLCTAGAVWWRYLVLGAVVLAAVLAGRSRPLPPEPLRSRRPAAGVLAFAGAVCMLAAGAAQFVLAAGTVSTFVRILLEVACAVWLSNLGRSWLRGDGWKTPVGGLPLAIAGSALFYWNVLMRFMENSSSWHRVQPTAAVWQEMAALLLLAALARTLYLPRPENGRALHAAALAAFACACAGSCPGCSCYWQQALAAAWRQCCRSCFPALHCAASAVWGLSVPERKKLEITDQNGLIPLVQLNKSFVTGCIKSYKSQKR